MGRKLGILILALGACATSASSTTSSRQPRSHAREDRDRVQIENAYADRDVRMLHELLDITTDKANHALAAEYYVMLRLESLTHLDCDAFFAAFQPVKKRLNPRTEFAAFTGELTPAKQTEVMSTVLGIAARCRSPQLFATTIHRLIPEATEDAWADALIAVDRKGLPVYTAFVASLRSSAKGMDATLTSKWLVATRTQAECHELEEAAQKADPTARASLVYFYLQKGCKAEAVHAARELLASRIANFRARGCRTLRELGDTSLIPQMEQLAKADNASKLEDDQQQLWAYSFTKFPVRETCQQALEQLRVKSAAAE